MNDKEILPPHGHSHMWIVGALGLAAGLALMILMPSLPQISQALFLFAGFHLAGAVVALASLYVLGGDRIVRRLSARGVAKRIPTKFDFGWAAAWVYGPGIAALIAVSAAVATQVVAPAYWPAAMALTLVAASSFAGHLIAAGSTRYNEAVLPMVDLLPGGEGTILDAGCGAGRTTVAIGRALKQARIVSLDLFNSDYIDGGGRGLLERNLRLADLSDRVTIQQGSITAMPFAAATFDAAVSAHAVDHLGKETEQGLREILRVLRPGGKFLLVVWVPGWTMFAVANVLSFFLAGMGYWRRMGKKAGFEIADEGAFNGMRFLLLKKPAI